MYMSRGCFAAHGTGECVVRNSPRLQIAAQPDALWSPRIQSDVNPARMIEAHRSMQSRCPHRADWQSMIKLLFVRGFKRLQIVRGLECAATFVMLHALGEDVAILDASGFLNLARGCFVLEHRRQLAHQTRSRMRQVEIHA